MGSWWKGKVLTRMCTSLQGPTLSWALLLLKITTKSDWQWLNEFISSPGSLWSHCWVTELLHSPCFSHFPGHKPRAISSSETRHCAAAEKRHFHRALLTFHLPCNEFPLLLLLKTDDFCFAHYTDLSEALCPGMKNKWKLQWCHFPAELMNCTFLWLLSAALSRGPCC